MALIQHGRHGKCPNDTQIKHQTLVQCSSVKPSLWPINISAAGLHVPTLTPTTLPPGLPIRTGPLAQAVQTIAILFPSALSVDAPCPARLKPTHPSMCGQHAQAYAAGEVGARRPGAGAVRDLSVGLPDGSDLEGVPTPHQASEGGGAAAGAGRAQGRLGSARRLLPLFTSGPDCADELGQPSQKDHLEQPQLQECGACVPPPEECPHSKLGMKRVRLDQQSGAGVGGFKVPQIAKESCTAGICWCLSACDLF